MIDLHLHTFYSDGILSPTQLVKEAKRCGIACMAITDHDGIAGLREGITASREEDVTFICGIEFSVQHFLNDNPQQAFYFHLLGYGIDSENPQLREKTTSLLRIRKERNVRMMETLQEKGFEIDWQDLKVHPQHTYVGKPNFARSLVKKGYAYDLKEAFGSERMLQMPEIKAIHRVKISAEEAIELIHLAGGKAVLAHPMKVTYRGKAEHSPSQYAVQLELLLLQLKALGLDGMECYYSGHTPAQTEYLLSAADRQKLLVTAGSDFHGEPDNERQIGKLQVDTDILRLEWIEELIRK